MTADFLKESGLGALFLSQWQTFANTFGDAIFVLDRHQRVVCANSAAETLCKARAVEMHGPPCHTLLHSSCEPYPDCPFTRAERSLRRETMEFHQGGQWFLVIVNPILGPTSQFAGAIHVVSNITSHKELELRLRENEARYRVLFDDATDGLLVADPETQRLLLCNPRICEMLGYTSNELRQLGVSDIHPAEALPDIIAKFQRQVRGEVELAAEIPFRRKNGSIFYADVTARPTHVDGRPCLMGIIRDATARIAAERTLRHREAMLAHSQRVAKFGHYELDTLTGVWTSSDALDNIFGIGPDFQRTVEMWGSLVHPDDRNTMLTYFQEHVLTEGRTFDREYRIVRPIDGAVRWVHGLGDIEVSPSGQPIRMFGVIQDITDRKNADDQRRRIESQMQHTQKLESLGLLCGSIAHDFNNLLAGIVGNVELAIDETAVNAPIRRNLDSIGQIADRAAGLCRQMLAYAGKGHSVPRKVNLDNLIRESAPILGVAISKKAILHYDATANTPSIEADAEQIKQVLMNLVINASEAIGDCPGDIRLSTGTAHCSQKYLLESYVGEPIPEGTYVYFEVSDTGHGMTDATCNRIFEPFFTTKFAGRGLGLSATLGIVRSHKGAIKVTSESGKGTRVRVLLPVANNEAHAQKATKPAQAICHASGHVLLADDEEDLRTIGKHFLEKLGFTVLVCKDGCDALETFRRFSAKQETPLSLVILDLTMPRMDGAEAMREIRKMDSNVPILIASGYDQYDMSRKFHNSEIDGFIQKPYRLSELSNKIHAAITASPPRQQQPR